MEDIIIGGYAVSKLKEIKVAIQQDAVKVIAENTDQALRKFEELKNAETKEEAKVIAQQISDYLEVVQVVSGVSGCVHYLPYYEEYGRYETDEVISHFLDENENEALAYDWKDQNHPIRKLSRLAYSLEQDSLAWHSSTC